MTEKKTVGEASLELAKKIESHNAIELQEEITRGSNSEKSQEEELWDCVNRGRRDSKIEGDFFVVIITKKERLLQNVIRFFYFYRKSCPTPTFDQTVFQYIRNGDELELIWCVPDEWSCSEIIRALKSGVIHPDQETLGHMCNAFIKGDLDKLCAKLNKEI